MTQKDIHVMIVEDDPYARDFMSLLLRRDWRTRVVGEFGSADGIGLHHALRQPANHIDVLVVDTEVPTDEQWPMKVAQMTKTLPRPPAILYTCTHPTRLILEKVLELQGGGYVSKGEILYALGSAISAVSGGQFVISPGVQMIAIQMALPNQFVVMDGMVPVANFTPRENDLSRLGLLLNLEQRDIADDLVVSTDFVAELMGHVYEKLGLHAILSQEKPPEEYFQDEKLLTRCRELIENRAIASHKKGRKTPWMSTLAFHLLTRPEVEEINR